MIYLSQFEFPSVMEEEQFINGIRETCYNTYYPFQVMPNHGIRTINFDDEVTILYGGNGCGKTTVLNIIAETLQLKRDALYNRTNFFNDYTEMCYHVLARQMPEDSRIITSDDVFDFMLNIRGINEGIQDRRKELYEEYYENKHANFQLHSLDDYDQLVKVNAARRSSKSQYVRERVNSNVREQSNGETAFMYFTDKIKENGLYLLDEPENSLSPERQQELLTFIQQSARFFGCQFIIATHSPFLLSMPEAKIYNLDMEKMSPSRWTDLPNVRAYYDFFKAHEDEF